MYISSFYNREWIFIMFSTIPGTTPETFIRIIFLSVNSLLNRDENFKAVSFLFALVSRYYRDKFLILY